MNEILEYLNSHGEQFDAAIAEAIRISLAEALCLLAELAAKGKVTSCHSIRYENGEKIEGILYRIAGYSPPVKKGATKKANIACWPDPHRLTPPPVMTGEEMHRKG